jgi:hypothetical protein
MGIVSACFFSRRYLALGVHPRQTAAIHRLRSDHFSLYARLGFVVQFKGKMLIFKEMLKFLAKKNSVKSTSYKFVQQSQPESPRLLLRDCVRTLRSGLSTSNTIFRGATCE